MYVCISILTVLRRELVYLPEHRCLRRPGARVANVRVGGGVPLERKADVLFRTLQSMYIHIEYIFD